MKEILKRLVVIALLLMCFIGVDSFSAFHLNKPLFILKKTENEVANIQTGFFYEVYECKECFHVDLLKKGKDYVCSENEHHEKRVKVTLVGDLLYEQPYYDALDAGENKDLYLNRVKKYFLSDDLSIGNMEVVIGNENMEVSGVGYNFCAPEFVGDLVSGLDFEVLGTANNHTFDRGVKGIHSTIDYFKNKTDIVTVGTYKDEKDRQTYRILDVNGIKVGILAYTYATNLDPSSDEIDMIAYFRNPWINQMTSESKEKIRPEIEGLRKQCDVLMVMMHWGREFTFTPSSEQEEMARFLNECGVDVIIGSHSHNIQPIKVIGDTHKTLVYYSLGNFVSHDEDLDRTAYGNETFDHAYQVGMIASLDLVMQDDDFHIENTNTELVINYFDDDSRNWELVPLSEYSEDYETSHYRYGLGFTKDFISEMYHDVIDEEYR